MKWKDSRVHKPKKNSVCIYPVIFLYEGHVFNGYSTWNSDVWIHFICTNGNRLGGEVLFWQDIPQRPTEIDL